MKKPIVEVKNLVKRYQKASVNAVDNISFHIEEGEFFAFLGPNGAGKTTTISILSTTLQKTSGTVRIAGHNLEKEPSAVRSKIGIIFQNPSIDKTLSAEENIRFHAILYGMYPFRPSFSLMPEQYKTKVQELSEVLDIQKDLFRPIGTFSGGMKRKLEIVRSLMHKPKVLFLDEPTSGLDPIGRRNLWQYLAHTRKKEKITILLTTHYLDEAEDADRICIINKGKVILQGTPQQIKKGLIDKYLYVDTQDRDTLRKELKKLSLQFEEKDGFSISLKKKTVQEVIHQIQTKLSVVRTHNPTLEDAYLEIVEN